MTLFSDTYDWHVSLKEGVGGRGGGGSAKINKC